MANVITCIRILLSAAILFCPALSPAFYGLYITAGLSDMLDGAVARKTGAVSERGARLDTLADIVFTAVCLIKLLPVLDVPIWLYVWISVIAIIKLINIAVGYVKRKGFAAVHSALNKVTGALLFLFPLTPAFIDLRYSAAVVCTVATAAAIQEGHLIRNDGGVFPLRDEEEHYESGETQLSGRNPFSRQTGRDRGRWI